MWEWRTDAVEGCEDGSRAEMNAVDAMENGWKMQCNGENLIWWRFGGGIILNRLIRFRGGDRRLWLIDGMNLEGWEKEKNFNVKH